MRINEMFYLLIGVTVISMLLALNVKLTLVGILSFNLIAIIATLKVASRADRVLEEYYGTLL